MATSNVTGESLLSTLRIPTVGEVIDLSLELHNDEVVWPGHGPFAHYQWMTHAQGAQMLGRDDAPSHVGTMSDRVELPIHAGTHVDALNHFSVEGVLHGGHRVKDVERHYGTTKLGIETSPVFVAPCFILDFERYFGRPMESGEPISAANVDDVLRARGIEKVTKGTVALLHTGWLGSKYEHARREYFMTEPGIDVEAARLLADAGFEAMGADTSAVEVVPHDRSNPYPVHQELIFHRGIHLFENVVTTELVRREINRCVFIATPLKIRGASGSPVRAVAIT